MGVVMAGEPQKRSFDWKWLVTTIISATAVGALILNLVQFQYTKGLAQKASEAEGPFLDLKLVQEKNFLSPRAVQIRNVGKRPAYNVSLGDIAGVRRAGQQRDDMGPPARPDAVPLPKVHIFPEETLEVPLPQFTIPADYQKPVLAGSQIWDIFFLLSFYDPQGDRRHYAMVLF